MLRTIQLYEQLSLFEASPDFKSELEALRDYLVKTKTDLNTQVNGLVANLHAQLTSEKLPNKTGFFRGIHQWWKNLWGRNKKDNPYYWQNRIGALGRTDLDPPTVEEYRMLNDLAVSLAEALESSPQPLIVKILNQWSSKLSSTINGYMDNMIARVNALAGKPGTPPVHPPAAPPAAKTPVKTDEEDPDLEEARAAWRAIKRSMSDEEKAEFKRLADEGRYKDAILYAHELEKKKAKPPSSIPTAPMRDDDEEDPVTPVKPGRPTPMRDDEEPAAPVKPKNIDDEARELGINPDTKTDLGAPFGKLSEKLKRFIVDACKAGTPECPTHKPTPEDDILAHMSMVDIHKILRKHEGKSVENVKSGREKIDDPAERDVILAVHEPWLSLTPGERKYHNDQGSLNVPLKSHNRVINGLTYPFRIPPVLRKEDPRFHILRDYYPEHFRKLNGVGRVERDEDTPESIEKRIKRNIRTGKVSGEFSTERGEESPVPRPRTSPVDSGEAPPEKKKKKPLMKGRMPAHPEDEIPEAVKDMVRAFPEEIATPIMKLAEKSEDQARDVAKAWESLKDAKRSHKKRFKELLDEGEFDQAIAMGADEGNDEDIKDMLSHYQPKGPSLLEALKTRLRLQREGKARAWEPMPTKVTPQKLVERLRRQSSKLYAES